MIPVQFYERHFKPESEGTIGVGANSDFHTILKNAKVGSNEMVNATIDIIGDPYWLDYTPAKSNFNDLKVAKKEPKWSFLDQNRKTGNCSKI